MRTATLAGLGLALWLLSPLAGAQQFEQVGDYQVHYSAVNTSFLSDEVAETYGIQRSPAHALLNVSVVEEQDDGSTHPVNVAVSGSVGPLSGSQSALAFRNVRGADDTRAQIATFRIHDDEPMRFDLDVTYDRNREPERVSFIQRFYIER
ncbi:protein of unknown function [Franzmannia pantelleriensis]|uniref:DUF4426 domain-containing protein n=1 Tax=Franzmannia pantelleriensis TaxID=48727 RepID=A0A1G9TIZ8_9GAMM|nr:DUF4426 domain-containing protein [Halomonas pantelleriensis]SDM47602.1 protein of unknown function [Halomonas pantelleriensis]